MFSAVWEAGVVLPLEEAITQALGNDRNAGDSVCMMGSYLAHQIGPSMRRMYVGFPLPTLDTRDTLSTHSHSLPTGSWLPATDYSEGLMKRHRLRRLSQRTRRAASGRTERLPAHSEREQPAGASGRRAPRRRVGRGPNSAVWARGYLALLPTERQSGRLRRLARTGGRTNCDPLWSLRCSATRSA